MGFGSLAARRRARARDGVGARRRGRSSDSSARPTATSAIRSSCAASSSAPGRRWPSACSSAYIWAAFTPVDRLDRAPLRAGAGNSGWGRSASSAWPRFAFPVLHGAVVPAGLSAPHGLPVRRRPCSSRRVRQLLPLAFPTHFMTFWGIVGATWMLHVRHALPRARAARLAAGDAADERAAGGPEDAAPPALPLQHAEQHPAARLPRRRGREPHGRAPGGPAAPLAPERDERPDPPAPGARAAARSTSRSSRRASRTG